MLRKAVPSVAAGISTTSWLQSNWQASPGPQLSGTNAAAVAAILGMAAAYASSGSTHYNQNQRTIENAMTAGAAVGGILQAEDDVAAEVGEARLAGDKHDPSRQIALAPKESVGALEKLVVREAAREKHRCHH